MSTVIESDAVIPSVEYATLSEILTLPSTVSGNLNNLKGNCIWYWNVLVDMSEVANTAEDEIT